MKTVVLTFDDAVSNHSTFVAPILKKYGFGASFYVCEFPPDFHTNKEQYMTWKQIKGLDDDGFEIGNHTGHHTVVVGKTRDEIFAEMKYLDDKCAEYGIRKPVSFAYPGGPWDKPGMDAAKAYGFKLARAVENRVYEPAKDDPMLIPSLPVHGDDPKVFYDALKLATDTAIPVLLFHGVPEYTHPWVNTPPALFSEYMEHLHKENYRVISLRDLLK